MCGIHKYRLAKGLSQSDLSKLLNVSQNTISQWEKGTRKPDIIMLKKLAFFLGCTTDELLEPIEI
nr:MAG TPA: Helix-turn-helix XRE-family like protein [Bacteriophage sp.]